MPGAPGLHCQVACFFPLPVHFCLQGLTQAGSLPCPDLGRRGEPTAVFVTTFVMSSEASQLLTCLCSAPLPARHLDQRPTQLTMSSSQLKNRGYFCLIHNLGKAQIVIIPSNYQCAALLSRQKPRSSPTRRHPKQSVTRVGRRLCLHLSCHLPLGTHKEQTLAVPPG